MSTDKIERNGNRTQTGSRKLNGVLCPFRVIRTLPFFCSGVYANVSANVITLNRCSVMEIRWNKNELWRLSSLMAARRWPSSWRNFTPLTLTGSSVSKANYYYAYCYHYYYYFDWWGSFTLTLNKLWLLLLFNLLLTFVYGWTTGCEGSHTLGYISRSSSLSI